MLLFVYLYLAITMVMEFDEWFEKNKDWLYMGFEESLEGTGRTTNGWENMDEFDEYCDEMYQDYLTVVNEKNNCLID